MKTVGIIAEYNPFHLGHRYHIDEAKRISGAERTLIVMSGSFVQRGEPACADKFIRAKWAVDNGADMVIELPEVFSLSCAERFAAGGVKLIKGSGIADCICFGSESGDIVRLLGLASAEMDESTFSEAIGAGASYPKAVASASGNKLDPNDILGIEYLRALKKYVSDITPYAVKRTGSGYAEDDLGDGYSSSKAIRNAVSSSGTRMSPAVFDRLVRAVPKAELEEISDMMKKGVFPAVFEGLSDPILYKFRSMAKDDIIRLPNVSEGLENLFAKHSFDSSDAMEMLEKVKSKRYTMARLKRIAMCALLGITEELQKQAVSLNDALYARVLAVRKGSLDMLPELQEKSTVPVVVQSADREKLAPLAAQIERISSFAHCVRSIGQPYEKQAVSDSSYRLIVR